MNKSHSLVRKCNFQKIRHKWTLLHLDLLDLLDLLDRLHHLEEVLFLDQTRTGQNASP